MLYIGRKIPVFFLRDESGAVHVDGGEGLFFMSPEDAKAKLQGLKGADGIKVKRTLPGMVKVGGFDIVQRCLPSLHVLIFISVVFLQHYNDLFGSLD